MEPCQHVAGNEAVAALLWLLTETAVMVRWASCLPEHAASDRLVLLQAVAGPLTPEGVVAASAVQRLLAKSWHQLAAAAVERQAAVVEGQAAVVEGQAAVVEAQAAQVGQPPCAQQQSAHCC